MPWTSAATKSITTTKPSTQLYPKPNRIAYNPPASPEIEVLPPTKREFFSGVSAVKLLNYQSYEYNNYIIIIIIFLGIILFAHVYLQSFHG